MPFPFRYKKLAYAAINVTDLEKSIDFYKDIVGLDLAETTEENAFFRCSKDHHNIVLCLAKEPGLKRVAFEVERDVDIDRAFEHFNDLGFSPAWIGDSERRFLKQGKTLRVKEPVSGLTIELFSSITQMATEFVPSVAKIARLGHVVIGSKDFDATCTSFVENFGFRVSDFIEDRICFMRCFPNPFHHTFAVGPSSKNRLHHVNFMVTDIDDVGKALYRLKQNDIKIVYGPGRHPPSNSVFIYFLDPDGTTLEYSFGMEEFPEDNAREPRMLQAVPESLDTWGAVPDPLFGVGGPIEGAP
ncbi:2,3-dihydroxy-p-cumate-3,4-dioxygenase [Marinobacter sp. NP-6]|uniref:VOC family protein n=1 Tax=Marinobacter sp. NP-6 TaxID=2488666 RepID=UPI000FCC0ED6|nr:VOC family protein [Marinobacter sp. NP-6]RUT76978.1 2,3-dihydroxy-p-cumate-3,4-dioxygenase [Marinobacter sp. NP-6]